MKQLLIILLLSGKIPFNTIIVVVAVFVFIIIIVIEYWKNMYKLFDLYKYSIVKTLREAKQDIHFENWKENNKINNVRKSLKTFINTITIIINVYRNNNNNNSKWLL